jgi:hypothetical protein
MHDKALAGLPEPVQARVRHMMASEEGLTVPQAVSRLLDTPEAQRFYAEQDQERRKHPQAPTPPQAQPREDNRTADLVACDEEIEELVKVVAKEQGLDRRTAGAKAAALDTRAGRRLYVMREALERGQAKTLSEARKFVETLR